MLGLKWILDCLWNSWIFEYNQIYSHLDRMLLDVMCATLPSHVIVKWNTGTRWSIMLTKSTKFWRVDDPQYKIAKMLDLCHPWNLCTSKSCMYRILEYQNSYFVWALLRTPDVIHPFFYKAIDFDHKMQCW